eukprot:1158397-Pelagomonas_calceolata.AAC.2
MASCYASGNTPSTALPFVQESTMLLLIASCYAFAKHPKHSLTACPRVHLPGVCRTLWPCRLATPSKTCFMYGYSSSLSFSTCPKDASTSSQPLARVQEGKVIMSFQHSNGRIKGSPFSVMGLHSVIQAEGQKGMAVS